MQVPRLLPSNFRAPESITGPHTFHRGRTGRTQGLAGDTQWRLLWQTQTDRQDGARAQLKLSPARPSGELPVGERCTTGLKSPKGRKSKSISCCPCGLAGTQRCRVAPASSGQPLNRPDHARTSGVLCSKIEEGKRLQQNS